MKLLYLESFCTYCRKLPCLESFCTQKASVPGKLLCLESFCAQKASVPRKRLYLESFCTQKASIPRKLLYLESFCTQKASKHRKLLHLERFCTQKASTHRMLLYLEDSQYTQVIQRLNHSCSHQGYCLPTCVRRQARGCRRLMEAIRQDDSSLSMWQCSVLVLNSVSVSTLSFLKL